MGKLVNLMTVRLGLWLDIDNWRLAQVNRPLHPPGVFMFVLRRHYFRRELLIGFIF